MGHLNFFSFVISGSGIVTRGAVRFTRLLQRLRFFISQNHKSHNRINLLPKFHLQQNLGCLNNYSAEWIVN